MKERIQQECHQVHNKNERVHRKNRSRARVEVGIDFCKEEGGRERVVWCGVGVGVVVGGGGVVCGGVVCGVVVVVCVAWWRWWW